MEAILIGNSNMDLLAAKNAGIKAYMYNYQKRFDDGIYR